jgi:ADP-heptose:LPS heptosyltransferase
MADEFERKRKEADIIIGVHIRRGDYKVWAGGKYYYDDETYISFIKQMSNLFQHKRILFAVCSNEELDHAKYEAIESDSLKLWFPKQNFINELYLLSKCDRIIGPPSTYSHWASFYGNVPCLHLTERGHVIELSEFEVCSG